jgi:hypothetical protein
MTTHPTWLAKATCRDNPEYQKACHISQQAKKVAERKCVTVGQDDSFLVPAPTPNIGLVGANLMCLDVEMTGIEFRKDQIIQLSFAIYNEKG